jgi:hypothetical protein
VSGCRWVGLMCMEFLKFLNFFSNSCRPCVLSLVYISYLAWCCFLEIGTRSVNWVQLGWYHQRTNTDPVWEKLRVSDINKTEESVQQHNNSIKIPASQTFRASLLGWCETELTWHVGHYVAYCTIPR